MKSVLAIVLVVALCQVQATTRIVSGTPVPVERRSTVAIFSYVESTPDKVDHFCSGALIHPEWVLTSATCVKMVEKYDMRVTTADLDKMSHKEFENAVMIKNKIAHPSFVATTLTNDIGLIQLEEHMKVTERTLKLPQVAIDLTNTPAIVRGYGGSAFSGVDDYLQKTRNVFIVDISKCVAKDIIMTNKICSMEPVACRGDEGGPLILKDSNTVVGITSVSEKHLEFCGMPAILSFTPYTNVWLYNAWIRQTTGLNL